jgi:hypothetical protein
VNRLRAAAFALGLLACLLAGLAAVPAQAAALRYCDSPGEMSHEQRDRLFRFAALVREELEGSGQRLALVSRSGLDLARFGQRYSHTGVSLKGNEVAPWSVRQLYYACEERKPRLFDQGITAFLLGLNDPQGGYISVVFLPEAAAATLEPAALDNRRALQLLATTYSANAYAYGLRYQNCNQWVMEMLASAWSDAPEAGEARVRAQAWMRAQGYAASEFRLPFPPLMWLSVAVPWLHHDDHPQADLDEAVFRVSMPASIEAFVRERVPGARRVEFCHAGTRVVVHRGWEPIAEGCEPGAQDRVVMLD